MNVVDWIIVGIIGVSVLFGLYRGFIASVASLAATLICWGGSYLLTPKAVDFVQANTGLRDTLSSYIDMSKLIGENSQIPVLGMDDATRAGVLEKIPKPLDSLVDSMLKSAGDAAGSVGDFLQNHLVDAAMKVICFIGCFLVMMLVAHLLITLLKTIFKFPVLKQMNTTAGGLFGLLRGILICFVLFAAVPLVQAVLSTENMTSINELVDSSVLAPLFNNGNMVGSITKISL